MKSQWPMVELGDVCHVQLGKMLSPKSKTGVRPVPYLRNENVQWNRFDLTDVSWMDFSEMEEEKFRLQPGDLLVCEGGEPGRAAVWQGQIERCCFQKALHRIRPRDETLFPPFLMYRLWMSAMNGEFAGAQTQTTISHVPREKLLRLKVPLPPLTEQRRIAAALTRALERVSTVESVAVERLAAAESLPAAYLREVFEGPEAGSWKIARIEDVAPIQTGLAFKSGWFVEVGGVRILRNANIHQGFVEWTDAVSVGSDLFKRFHSYSLNSGDIVLTLDRPIVANGLKVARLSKDDVPALLNQRVARLKTVDSRIDPDYLYAFLRSPAFTNAIRGHDQSLGVPHISPQQVGRVEIPLPSIARQKSVVADLSRQLEAAESLIARCRDELAAIGAFPASVLSAAFNGES